MMFDDDQMALRDRRAPLCTRVKFPGPITRSANRNPHRPGLVQGNGLLGLIGVDLPEEYGGLGSVASRPA